MKFEIGDTVYQGHLGRGKITKVFEDESFIVSFDCETERYYNLYGEMKGLEEIYQLEKIK